MEHELVESCMNIPLAKIPAYIFHFADQAFKNNGILLDELVKIKKQGYVNQLGRHLGQSFNPFQNILVKRAQRSYSDILF